METMTYILVWIMIVTQALGLLTAFSVFLTRYKCTFVEKMLYAAYSLAVSAILVRLGFYFLNALETGTLETLSITLLIFLVGMVQLGLSVVMKRILLKVLFRTHLDSINEAFSRRS